MRKNQIVGANIVHREYIARLYEKLNRKLEKKYRKGSVLEKITVESIEEHARSIEITYNPIAGIIVEKVEALLATKLPYWDKAAIAIRQAEYVFDRPLFRRERGYLLSREYEENVRSYISPYTSGFFAAEWTPQRCLIRREDREFVESTTRVSTPPATLNHKDRFGFVVCPSFFIPAIEGDGTLNSDYAELAIDWYEFPPGVTMEEMKKVLEESEKQAREFEKEIEGVLGERIS